MHHRLRSGLLPVLCVVCPLVSRQALAQPPPAAAPPAAAAAPMAASADVAGEPPPPPPLAGTAPDASAPPEWDPAPPPPDAVATGAPAAPRRSTVTAAGLPAGKRGAIAIDTASFAEIDGDYVAVSLDAFAKIPLTSRTFIDTILPIGILEDRAILGNPMLGMHRVLRPGRRLWVTVGGMLGLPLLSMRGRVREAEPSIPRAYWNVDEFLPGALPVHGLFDMEYHAGPAIFRLQIEPAFFAPIGRRDEFGVVFQHGIEAQFGHTLGAGLRFQGVAQSAFDDAYQLAIEPFFTMERELAFLRLGVMMPIDEFLGPPFVRGWGFRLATGIRLE